MPRPNLRQVQPLVAAFCADLDVTYTQASLLGSYGQALGHLASVGAELADRGRVKPVPVAQP
jgi:hypothetical protein